MKNYERGERIGQNLLDANRINFRRMSLDQLYDFIAWKKDVKRYLRACYLRYSIDYKLADFYQELANDELFRRGVFDYEVDPMEI